MHKRLKSGFTIVEVLVVSVTIGIIISVGAVAYNQVQTKARDGKRDADMTVLMNELEKFYDRKGEYPPGCPDTSCSNSLHTANTSVAAFTTATTLTTLRSALPGIKDNFGDPQSPNRTLPFKNRTLNEKKYIYFGGTINNTGGSLTLDSVTHTNFPCTLRSTLAAGAAGSYVIGYYHEQTSKWVLKGGRNGIQMTIAAGLASDGCVIIRG